MDRRSRHLAALLSPLLLVTACGSGQQHTARLLDGRLHELLASDIAAGNAALQPLPNGDQVILLDTSLFPDDVKTLDNQQVDVRANVIEALLDPSLMQIQIADTTTLPDQQKATRVRNVSQYFVAYGLESTLLTPSLVPAAVSQPGAAAPAGLTITITLQCPDRHGGSGYGDGTSKPICD